MIRGNTGIFYDTLESSLINRESNFGPVGQAAIDLRQGDPLFPTFPNSPHGVPDRARPRCRARRSPFPSIEGDDFPLSIGDTLQRVAPYFFNSTIGFQRELGPNWAMSADYVRVRAYDMLVDARHQRAAVLPARARADAHRGAGQPAAAARRAEPHRRTLQHPVHRLPRPAAAVQRRRDAVRRAQARRRRDARRRATRSACNYTYSKARGDVDNFRLTESFVPGLTDIDGDRSYQQGPSASDAPHNLDGQRLLRVPRGGSTSAAS